MPLTRLGAVASLALLLVLGDGRRAHAADAATPAPTTELTSWYGYQILLADAASLGLGLLADSPEILIGSYLIGPVILHAVHRRPGLAMLSPAMRIFLPLLGVAIGTQHKTCNANGDECLLGGLIVGGGIGVATALILDWSLAWEKSVVPPPADRRPAGFALTTAGVAPREGGLNLVIGGRF